MKRAVAALVAVAAVAALAPGASAAAAPADAAVAEYLDWLDRHGVGYQSATAIVDVGWEVCAALRRLTPLDQVAAKLYKIGFNPVSAGHVIHAAARSLCVDTRPFVVQQAYESVTGQYI